MIKIFLQKLFIRRNIHYTILIKLILIVSHRDPCEDDLCFFKLNYIIFEASH